MDEKLTEDALVKKYAHAVYQKCNYSKKETADFLGINYRTLMSRLEESDDTT